MFNRMFNHINLMEKSLDTLWLRQEVIAHNIANAETPGYKTQHVEFEEAFRQALVQNQGQLALKTSTPGHITITTGTPMDIQPVVVRENWHTKRMDGNNVDIDGEMTELAANTIQYNLTVQKLTGEMQRLRTAIAGT